MTKISIIIPLYDLNNRFRKDFSHFLDLDYPDYELIIVHDNSITFKHERTITLNTDKNRTSPAEKRDLAIKVATGQICAFIDDDAYPDKGWIKNAIRHFSNEKIAAVGGPGLTPCEDNFMMRAGGLCYESILGSGPNRYRFVKGRQRLVDDITAYNLFVRKNVLEKTGGFGSTFYGGEDTKLCLEILKLKKEILYTPDVIVFHHRRPLFYPHIWQVGNVGLHRGYFVKKYPETSKKLVYFLPSLFTLFLFLALALSPFSRFFTTLLINTVLFFLITAYASCLWQSRDFKMSAVSSLGILLMHLSYGVNFLRGLGRKELKT